MQKEILSYMLRVKTGLYLCRYTISASVSVILLGLMISTIGRITVDAYADNPATMVDTLSVTVDSTCHLTHSGGGTYTKTINPGSTVTVTANTITCQLEHQNRRLLPKFILESTIRCLRPGNRNKPIYHVPTNPGYLRQSCFI